MLTRLSVARVFFALVVSLSFFCPRLASAGVSLAEICKDAPQSPSHSPVAVPDFVISASGAITRPADWSSKSRIVRLFTAAERTALRLPEREWLVVVRIDALASVDTGVPPATKSRCGAIERGEDIELPDLRESDDVWRITVYIAPTLAKALGLEAKARTDGAATKRVADVYANEAALVYAKGVSAIVVAEAAQRPPVALSGFKLLVAPDRTPETTMAASARIAQATSVFDRVTAEDLAAAEMAHPLARAALHSFVAEASALHAYAERLAVAYDPVDRLGVIERWRALFTKATDVKKLRLDEAYCESKRAVLEHELPDEPAFWGGLWPLGAFELPSTSPSHTVVLSSAQAEPVPVDADGPVTAWAKDVPAGSDLKFSWMAGKSTAPDAFKAIGSFLGVLGSNGLKAASAPDTSILGQLTSDGECAKLPPATSWGSLLLPLARYESHARTSATAQRSNLLRDRVYKVYACSEDCVTTGDKQNIVRQAAIETPAGFSVTLLGSLSYNFALADDATFGDYRWVQTSAAGDTQRVYEVGHHEKPLDNISSSLLLTFLLPEYKRTRFGFGVGPTILYGSGSGALKQWTVNVVASSKQISKHLYFAIGLGGRMTDKLLNPELGERFVIDGTDTTKLPGLNTAWKVVPVLSLGLALDLAVLGDAAKTVFGTKGDGT